MDELDLDPYLYPATYVLKNRHNVLDNGKLEKLERRFTTVRARQGLPAGRLDYTHYKSIHRHLFQDIYDWTGKARTMNLSKGGSSFCRVEFIDSEMTKLLAALRKENLLKGLDFPAAATRAAHYLIELNAIHPFREGNGRTQHAFLALLMERAGHPRDLSKVDPERLLQAAIDGFNGDEEPMIAVITNLPPRSGG